MLKCTEVLATMCGFAAFCAASGQTDNARKFYEQVLEGYEGIFGKVRGRFQALLPDSVSPLPQRSLCDERISSFGAFRESKAILSLINDIFLEGIHSYVAVHKVSWIVPQACGEIKSNGNSHEVEIHIRWKSTRKSGVSTFVGNPRG